MAILVTGCLLAWLLLFWNPDLDKGQATINPALDAEPTGGDFSLNSSRGPVALSDYRGKVVLLYFGYTWCPDICPTTLAMIGTTLSAMDEAHKDRIQPLFISVDPDRDTPQRLQEYVEYFYPSLLGLTGTKSEIDDIVARYGAAYRIVDKKDDQPYVVDHTADTYIIDKQGKLVRRLAHGSSSEEILGALGPLLQENLSR
ncbi:MAG: SCO family protein [Candidatus Thiodiazotropha sp.]